ncbi:hypothetical protein QBC42DRAFT_231138 [Cladorrhinum samala]|uniref:Uncharacterized protein n=1 Tax=Cladorrhinum samala TaxID=585594 RepID=A0AAV9HG60_9PEZI|nr:hypothetical protein QBC42DRAFT_231138 [Cladorrhinum samala]
MQANLFKLVAIAAAFSAVHSAPAEAAAEVTKPQVNGTQTNSSYKLAGRLTPILHLLRSRKSAIRRGTLLTSAKERRRELFSSGLAGSIGAGKTVSADLSDVPTAFCTLTSAATRGLPAVSAWSKNSSPRRRRMDMGMA